MKKKILVFSIIVVISILIGIAIGVSKDNHVYPMIMGPSSDVKVDEALYNKYDGETEYTLDTFSDQGDMYLQLKLAIPCSDINIYATDSSGKEYLVDTLKTGDYIEPNTCENESGSFIEYEKQFDQVSSIRLQSDEEFTVYVYQGLDKEGDVKWEK